MLITDLPLEAGRDSSKTTVVHWRLRPANYTNDVGEYVRDVTTPSRVDFVWVMLA